MSCGAFVAHRGHCKLVGDHFVSLCGISDAIELTNRAKAGDAEAERAWKGFLYQTAKYIGEMAAVLCGKVDAIILTGGLLRFADVSEGIRKRCGFIAPVEVYPGEMEQEALAIPALKALRGEIEPMKYTGKNVWNGFGEIGL